MGDLTIWQFCHPLSRARPDGAEQLFKYEEAEVTKGPYKVTEEALTALAGLGTASLLSAASYAPQGAARSRLPNSRRCTSSSCLGSPRRS